MYKYFILLVFVLTGCVSLSTRYYTAKKGDTLSAIASKHGVSLEQLTAHNDHARGTLRPGQKIYIPYEATAAWQARYGTTSVANDGSKADGLRALRGISSSRVNAGYFVWPVSGRISSDFGRRRNRRHEGVDIVARHGSPVRSALEGKVIYQGNQLSGYGNMIIVQHVGGLTTVYGHLSRIRVKKGQHVGQGETIGNVGQTGRAHGPHLHFEVRHNHRPMDPREFLPIEGRFASASQQSRF